MTKTYPTKEQADEIFAIAINKFWNTVERESKEMGIRQPIEDMYELLEEQSDHLKKPW